LADRRSTRNVANSSLWIDRGSSRGELGGLDYLAIIILAALLFFVLVYRSDALPMQLWDESRNADNALQAALAGHWLVPAYEGVADHWNTKPPLLIWLIAAFLKLGLPLLWALRLPEILAAAATLVLIWRVLRRDLRDRLAAAVAGALLLTASLYLGVHATRTGDYDGLESLFILGYVLAVWRLYADPARSGGTMVAVVFLVAAVLTKGVAAALPLPGLVAFALVRRGATLRLLKQPRVWWAIFAAVVLCLGYYASRELYDPGYLHAVVDNELGGRFLNVQDAHRGGPWYYAALLAGGFLPGWVFLPFTLFTLFGRDGRRRDLALLTLAAAACLLIVLSLSRTKLAWYATPAIPLLAIAGALGASDGLRALACRHVRLGEATTAALSLGLAVAAAMAIWRNQDLIVRYPDRHDPRVLYGPFMTTLHDRGLTAPVTIIDTLHWNSPGVTNYEPIVDVYRSLYARDWKTRLAAGQIPASGEVILTCSPRARAWLTARYALSFQAQSGSCLLARVN
jgi:4-amino-4-deoxy-L-arabinose transferase-like glycosyltransferase